MPLFRCTKCDVVENTGLCNYWLSEMEAHENEWMHEPLCSQCDPDLGKWHGQFPRETVGPGWFANPRGHLWRESQIDKVQHMGPFTPVQALAT